MFASLRVGKKIAASIDVKCGSLLPQTPRQVFKPESDMNGMKRFDLDKRNLFCGSTFELGGSTPRSISEFLGAIGAVKL